jgi:uncharacterized membrane protein
MEALAPFHPAIVHTPIALIIVGAVFELVGRALDSEWWRKAAFAMLIVGVMGAALAVLSGDAAGEHAEHQGVSEQAVDEHEEIAKLTLWLGLGAVVARALAGRAGAARAAVAGLALLLHLAAATTVGIAGFRGGRLVFEHGAGVKVSGKLLAVPEGKQGGAGEAGEKGEADEKAADGN